MSKIKELKKRDYNNINVIDLYKLIIESDKTKYIDLLNVLIPKKIEENFNPDKFERNVQSYLPNFKVEGLSVFEAILLNVIIDYSHDENIKNYIKFVNYNERGLIDNNDVTTYKNFEQICKEVNKADLKDLSKSLSKQVVTLLNDDEWIIVKPLTYESSKKYGSNTKWCTTSASSPEYFYKYFRNGILTYCLNKKTGYKIAVYKALNEKTVTFWNQEDSSIDSFGSELPTEIISLLRKEYNECKKSNFALSDQDFVEKEMNLNGVVYRDRTARGNVRVGNQFDGEQPEDEGPGEDAALNAMAAEIDREIIRDIRMLGDEPFAPQPGAAERVYGGPGVPIGIDVEAELTALLDRELNNAIQRELNNIEDNPHDYIDVETEVRPLHVRMDHIIDDTFIREINTDDQDIPEVNLELESREIVSGIRELSEIDFDDRLPPLHHGVEYRDGMPVGRMVTEEVLNVRREEVQEFLNMGRHNGEQIRQAVEEIRNERIR